MDANAAKSSKGAAPIIEVCYVGLSNRMKRDLAIQALNMAIVQSIDEGLSKVQRSL